jgi:signal peptidase I
MSATVAAIYWTFFIITTLAIQVGLWGVFVKAGQPGWKSLIPFYNYWVTIRIVEKPKWWLALVFIPIVNLVMPLVIVIELCKYFGKPGLGWQTVGMLFPYLFLPYIGFSPKVKYGKLKKTKKKSRTLEWAEAIVFALISAAFIRTFFIEAYRIPTPSMEGSLLVGDHLFVSKFHYGARFPMTPIAFPLAHHTMPLLGTKAYLDWPHLPYFRFPGLQKIHRNDVVVFNFPEGDTVVIANQAPSYYDLKRQRQRFTRDQLTVRPVDKNENYVKRCVAIAGDSLQVKNGQLFINGQAAENPAEMQFMYWVSSTQTLPDDFFGRFGISEAHRIQGPDLTYAVFTTPRVAMELRHVPAISSVVIPFQDSILIGTTPQYHNWTTFSQLFPNDSKEYSYTTDNYGPIWVPQKGKAVQLNADNMPFYRRVIQDYEGNQLEERQGKYFINGVQATQYTFRYDYYFMMGDNRHNSQDSRFWGFVPETHIVGKPWFIWFSWDKNASGLNKIRWERLFRAVK